MSNPITITIAAGSCAQRTENGKYLSIQACTLPITAAFDGGPNESTQAGRVTDKSTAKGGAGFKFFTLANPNAIAVTLTFIVANHPVIYQPADNSSSNAGNYSLGNFGVQDNTAAAGGLPGVDANGYLIITAALGFVVNGTNNGHRRQQITFTMSPTSAANLRLSDANGCGHMVLLAGDKISLVTDSVYLISGIGGTASVMIGQMFLTQ